MKIQITTVGHMEKEKAFMPRPVQLDHLPPVEVSVCSLCIFRLFAQKHDPIEIGSVPVRRRQDDIDEHMFAFYADIGISDAMPRKKLCRAALFEHCNLLIFLFSTRHSFRPLSDISLGGDLCIAFSSNLKLY